MRVYISGRMSGLPEYNYPAFREEEERLRAEGFDVINPIYNFDGRTDLPRPMYMRADMAHVLEADAILLLPGWEQSPGACIELAMALELQIPAFYRLAGRRVTLPRQQAMLGISANWIDRVSEQLVGV